VILTAFAHDGQSLEAGVAFLEREVHPAAPLELRRFVALVDLRLEGAVRVLLGFDQQVEAARARVPRDVLVPVALARATEPAVRLPSGLEAAMDARDAADVVEDDVVVRAPWPTTPLASSTPPLVGGSKKSVSLCSSISLRTRRALTGAAAPTTRSAARRTGCGRRTGPTSGS
jgi:hypothetical protein